jgi:hypothetical protein
LGLAAVGCWLLAGGLSQQLLRKKARRTPSFFARPIKTHNIVPFFLSVWRSIAITSNINSNLRRRINSLYSQCVEVEEEKKASGSLNSSP